MDWQNLRLSLASARRRPGPTWVLHALVDEIRGVLPDTGPEAGTIVRLLLTPATEHRADRVLLEAAAFSYPSATVEVRYVDGDMLGIELALQVSDAWHDHPDATLAIVTDAGRFASVARHYEGRPGRRAPWLLYLHERPPVSRDNPGGPGDVGPPTTARRLWPQLDRPAEPRDWNQWDRLAWALRRLAGRIDTTPLRQSLRLDPDVRLDELEPVDNLVADLWRLEWGAPFDRDRAEAEAVRRGVGEAEARAAVDALLAAQLVRWHDRDRLEVPPGWREGLLLPMRRVVLRLARQADLSWPLAKLVQQHRRRFIGPAAAEPGGLLALGQVGAAGAPGHRRGAARLAGRGIPLDPDRLGVRRGHGRDGQAAAAAACRPLRCRALRGRAGAPGRRRQTGPLAALPARCRAGAAAGWSVGVDARRRAASSSRVLTGFLACA